MFWRSGPIIIIIPDFHLCLSHFEEFVVGLNDGMELGFQLNTLAL
jgi:hypothetical protein